MQTQDYNFFSITIQFKQTMTTNSKANMMEIIQHTAPAKIADLDIVRDRYIQNYNACHREKVGDLMYHRNVIHFKQIVAASPQLAKADPFSLYAAFATAAVNGYSLDPNDNEVYLIARGGKACLDRQAGAYVRRLVRTNQAQFFEQAKLVYQGDTFQVENGRVVRHVENFQSDIIVAGYVRVVIGINGEDRFFIYRKSDFESWRKKSTNPATIMKNGQNGQYLSESLWDNGTINGTQPEPNFLRTKIIKHAGKEKCWATGSTPPQVEVFEDIEIDTEDLPQLPEASGNYAPTMIITPAQQVQPPQPEPQQPTNGQHFAPAQEAAATVTVEDDDEVF
jgi:recombinational DNA repair protein RecT